MLALLLLHIVITLASLFTGFLFYSYVIDDINYEKANRYRHVIFYLITGVIVLTLITQLIIVFFPATFLYRYILLLLAVIAIITTRKRIIPFISFLTGEFKKFSIPVKTVLVATWFLILMLNAGPVMMDDTDSYHIQMVKWVQEYGTVPGIVNLHGRFGFNTSWFSSIALFGFEWKGHNFFTGLNGVLSLWFVTYLLSVADKSLKKENNESYFALTVPYFIIFLIALVSWPIIRGNPSNSNYDFISLLVVFVLLSETLRTSTNKNSTLVPEWIIWPAFLFTIRIINFPFLMLSVFAFFVLLKQKDWRKIFLYTFCCLLLILPFLIRNIIISGYPLYPAMYFNWFAVDWKADNEKTIELLRFIKYYNRVETGIQDLGITESLIFPDWIIAWFKYMYTYNKILFIPGMTGILLSPFLLRRQLLSSISTWLMISVIMLQVIVWFFSAPDPRFIYGSLFAGILILMLLLKNLSTNIYFTKFSKYLFFATASGIMCFSLNKMVNSDQYRNWLLPSSLPVPPVKNITIDNVQLHIPEKILNNWNPRCYATDLPCLYEIDPRLKLRGKEIADGFKLESK